MSLSPDMLGPLAGCLFEADDENIGVVGMRLAKRIYEQFL